MRHDHTSENAASNAAGADATASENDAEQDDREQRRARGLALYDPLARFMGDRWFRYDFDAEEWIESSPWTDE